MNSKSNSNDNSTSGFATMAPAFAALDQPEHEKQLLVADARRQKLPGAAAASRWSLDTLRRKLDRGRRPAPFDKKAFRKGGAPGAVQAEAPATAKTASVAVATPTETAPVVVLTPAPAETAPVAVLTPAPAETAPVAVLTPAPAEAAPVAVLTPAPAEAAPVAVLTPAETPASKPASNGRRINRGDRFTAKVSRKVAGGVVVQLPKRRLSAFLHESELSGGGAAARRRRMQALNVGDEMQVEIVRAGKAQRSIRASERVLSNAKLLAELKPGTTVKALVIELQPWGVITTIQDGLAQGHDAVIHVSKFPGKGADFRRQRQRGQGATAPSERDNALRATKLGQVFDAEVLTVEPHHVRECDLNIRLTLRGPEERAFLARYNEGSRLTGRIVAHDGDVFIVRFGRVKGFLPEAKLGGAAVESLHVGENVHVRVESFDEVRMTCQLTRRGL